MKITGEQALKLRKKLGLNQTEFWNVLGVTQSGGCRYEAGRNMPIPVQRLYFLVYVSGIPGALTPKAQNDFLKIGGK